MSTSENWVDDVKRQEAPLSPWAALGWGGVHLRPARAPSGPVGCLEGTPVTGNQEVPGMNTDPHVITLDIIVDTSRFDAAMQRLTAALDAFAATRAQRRQRDRARRQRLHVAYHQRQLARRRRYRS